jgi:hypothetical protein
MSKNNKLSKAMIDTLSRRNPMHNHPLLSKGGVHRKTNKSKRRVAKLAIKKEWLPQNIFYKVYFGEAFLKLTSWCK